MGKTEKIVIFGASNAAGIYGFDAPKYTAVNIVSAVIEQKAYVKRSPEELLIDLSRRPNLPESDSVINAGLPGDSIVQMKERFEADVLSKSPTHVFIWPGLNDAGIAMALWNNQVESVEEEYLETVEVFSEAMKGAKNLEQALISTSRVVVDITGEMVDHLNRNHIQTFIGTIPPFSSRLTHYLEKGEPVAKSQLESLPMIELINKGLRKIGGDRYTVDVYQAVVDPTTGLMRPEFSWGEQKKIPDTLHLSDRGQIIVGIALCSKYFNIPTRTILPGGIELNMVH